MATLEQKFINLVRSGREHDHLTEMLLLLGKLADNGLSIDACEARLDTLVLQSRGRLDDSLATGSDRAAALCRFMAREQGFLGNSESYYEPANSYIDSVLNTRRGIPISLAFLYIHVARSHGWLAKGVAFPGHFLVAVYDQNSELKGPAKYSLLDPFNGQLLQRADCLALLQRQFGQDVHLQERYFYAADNATIARRMLANLKQCHLRAERYPEALRVVNILLGISPADISELHDRAAILEHLHCYAAAAADLEAISMHRPDHPRLIEIRSSIVRLEQRSSPTFH